MAKYLSLLLYILISTLSAAQAQPHASWCVAGGEYQLCVGGCIHFINSSTNATSYEWHFFDGATPSFSTDTNPTVCYSTGGGYKYLYLVAINGNQRDSADILDVGCSCVPEVFDVPKVTLTVQNNQLHANTVFMGGGISLIYDWYNDNHYLTLTNDGNSNITPAIGQDYEVSAYDRHNYQWNGCSAKANLFYTGNKVTGKCFIDYNHNEVQDTGEPGYNKMLLQSSGPNNNTVTQPDRQGYYNNYADTGAVITTPLNVVAYYTYTPLEHQHSYSGFSQVDTADFAFSPIPGIRDLRITMTSTSTHRLGRDVYYQIIYTNAGTDTVTGGRIILLKDSKLAFASSSPVHTSSNGDSLIWSYSNLLPNETRTINITLQVPIPPMLNVGDHVSSMAFMEPLSPNVNSTNNYAYINAPVNGSQDPNLKTCLFGDKITKKQIDDGQYLTYTIFFQNTGNDTAFKIIVYDTLSNKLNAGTMELLSVSHPCTMNILNNNAIFLFDPILLPDSTINEPASHGYICYRIKPKSNVAIRNIISNRASIIFDYNPPVATNTAMTTVTSPVVTEAFQPLQDNFTVFPDPVNGQLMIDARSMREIHIYDVLGTMIFSGFIASSQTNLYILDVNTLSPGIYLIELIGDKEKKTARFLKE